MTGIDKGKGRKCVQESQTIKILFSVNLTNKLQITVELNNSTIIIIYMVIEQYSN